MDILHLQVFPKTQDQDTLQELARGLMLVSTENDKIVLETVIRTQQGCGGTSPKPEYLAYRISNKEQAFRLATEVNGLKEGIFISMDSAACIGFEVMSALGGGQTWEFRPRKVNGR